MVGTRRPNVRPMTDAGGTRQGERAAALEPSSNECIFCDIVDGRRDAHIVWHDEVAIAFLDRSPLFLGHTLVVPRRHAVTIDALDRDEVGPFFERVQLIAKHMPLALGAGGTFIANNNVVSQSVAHLHVHVIPRTKGDGLRGFFWPRQKYAAGQADELADRLRRFLDPIHLD